MKPIRDIPKSHTQTIVNTNEIPDVKPNDIQNQKEKQVDAASTTVKHRIPTNATKDIKAPVSINNIFDSAFMTTVVIKTPKSLAASAGISGQAVPTQSQAPASSTIKANATMNSSKTSNSSAISSGINNIFESSLMTTVTYSTPKSSPTPAASSAQAFQAQGQPPASSAIKANSPMGPTKNSNASVSSVLSGKGAPASNVQKPISNYVAPGTTFDIKNFYFDYGKYENTVPIPGQILGSEFNLTKAEMVAITAYTHDCYKAINYQLRNLPDPTVNIYDAQALQNSGVPEDLAFLIANLVNGLKKLPPAHRDDGSSTVINRGIGRDVNLPPDELAKFQEGDIVSSLMLTSTTSALEQMVEGGWWSNNPHALVIHQRLNGNGRDIAAFSIYPLESEIIFLPGTQFKVTYRKDDAVTGGPVNRNDLKGKTEDEIRQAYNDPSGPTYQKTIIALTEIHSA